MPSPEGLPSPGTDPGSPALQVGVGYWGRKWQPLQYSCLGNPWTEEPGGLQCMESRKSWTQFGYQTATTSLYSFIYCDVLQLHTCLH